MNKAAKNKSKNKPHPKAAEGERGAEEAPQAAPEEHPAAPAPEPEPADHQLLRLRADFDNFRKRIQREKAEWSKQALVNIVEDLVTVLDHFEMGIENAEQHEAQQTVLDGFKLVYEQFTQSLQKHGLTPIEAEGKAFNPEVHEAISHLASEEQEADVVMVQTRRGYQLGDRLIRPAQVVVSSGPGPAAPSTDSGDPQDV